MPDIREAFHKLYSAYTPEAALEGLRKAINKPPSEGEEIVPGWPKIAVPPGFRPFPEVIGDSALYNAVRNVFRAAPEIQGQFKRIGYPPTPNVMHEMYQSRIVPDQYAQTNLMGATDVEGGPDRQVYINPNTDDIENTVLHELSHVAGMGEAGAQEMEAAYARGKSAVPKPSMGGLIRAMRKP